MWNYRRVNNWSILHVFWYFVAIKRPKSPWEAGNGGVLLANLCCTADRTLCFVPVLGTPLIWEHHHIFWDGKRHDLNPSTPAGAVGVPNLWLKFQWITGNHALHPFASLKCIAFLLLVPLILGHVLPKCLHLWPVQSFLSSAGVLLVLPNLALQRNL